MPDRLTPSEALATLKQLLNECDSELSAQAHGRCASHSDTLGELAQRCRNAYEGYAPLIAPIAAALARPTPGEVEAAMDWLTRFLDNSLETAMSEVAVIAGLKCLATLRAALPAQGTWSKELPTEPGWYWYFREGGGLGVVAMHVWMHSNDRCLFVGMHPIDVVDPGWWMPAALPSPPDAEPKS